MSEGGCIQSMAVNDLHVHGKTRLSGVINTDITSSAATSVAIDLTAVTSDHKLFTSGALSAAVKLPQATASNIGMVIEVFIGTTTESGDATCTLSVKQASSTIFIGGYTTCIIGGGAAGKESTSIAITANAQSIVLDSNNVATAGGGKGSYYKFTYVAADTVFVQGLGMVTGTTATAPTAAGSVVTGWS
jgi:hypothetical protein